MHWTAVFKTKPTRAWLVSARVGLVYGWRDCDVRLAAIKPASKKQANPH